ncbi:hypothetical protein J6590_001756 [Homalodisca vitripennis]|nr:hypothetical protein J6590_001756 [Homalodisca vitripennis]
MRVGIGEGVREVSLVYVWFIGIPMLLTYIVLFTACCSKGEFNVTMLSIPNFSTSQAYLTEWNVSFFICSLPGIRPTKGLPPFATTEEVQNALSEQRLSVGDIYQLHTKRGRTNLCVVSLYCDSERDCADTRPAKIIYNIYKLVYVRVAVRFYRKRPGRVLCHRRQQIGHGSDNCDRPARCGK